MMIRLFLVALVLAAANAIPAYGHFFGATQSVDNYQVVFSPYPSNPVAGNSTFLNFSVLQNNTNVYNIHSAVVIKDKQSGETVDTIPYKLYEFSDITVPYTFANNGYYVVRLETRITGDEKYETDPLVANFDLFIGQTPFDELMLLYITPAAVAIAGIVVYLHSKKKL